MNFVRIICSAPGNGCKAALATTIGLLFTMVSATCEAQRYDANCSSSSQVGSTVQQQITIPYNTQNGTELGDWFPIGTYTWSCSLIKSYDTSGGTKRGIWIHINPQGSSPFSTGGPLQYKLRATRTGACTASGAPVTVNITSSGSAGTAREFQLLFNDCKGYSQVRYRLQPNPWTATSNAIIPNTTGSGYATGVGVQILENTSGTIPVTFSNSGNGDSVPGYNPSCTGSCNYSIPLRARIIRTGNITAGNVSAQMHMVVTHN